MKQRIIDKYGVDGGRIAVITNWADTTKIPVMSHDTAYRRENHLDGFVVMFLGNFGTYMDFDQILESAARMTDVEPSVMFALIGDGVQKQYVLDRAQQMDLKNVRILPKVAKTQVSEVMGSCDVALIPLDPNMAGIGVPSKLYSSLASGRPIISIVPSGSEVASTLEESGAGINVPHARPDLLVSAIMELYRDVERRSMMGEAARTAAESRFTLSRTADQFAKLFREVAIDARNNEAHSPKKGDTIVRPDSCCSP
jgi:glycosyltransferase involved in cell wall biosynthesis